MVPDYESAKAGVPLYIDAKRAYYVIMQNLKTPMRVRLPQYCRRAWMPFSGPAAKCA